MEYIVVQHRLVAVDELDKAFHAAGKSEVFLFPGELIHQPDLDAVVEEGQLAQPFRQDVVVVFDRTEGRGAREEMHLGAAALGRAGLLQRRGRNPVAEFHAVGFSLAPYGEAQPLGQGIDHGHADAVQTARNLVRIVVELAAGVQFGHDDFGGRAPLFVIRMYPGGNAAAVVGDANGVVGMNGYRDVVAIAGQRLVDGIVHHLEHHVMQAGTIGGIADVHAGTLAHRIQTLEHLDAALFVVTIADMLRTCFIVHSRSSLNLYFN